MSDPFPLFHMLATGVPCFVLGMAVGVYRERHQAHHKRTKESIMRRAANAYQGWYERRAPVLVLVVTILALIGIWVGASATITNGQQDRRADAANKAVQRCFDRYASAQSASSKAVREASVVKDEAVEQFNKALNAEGRAFEVVVDRIIADTLRPQDVQRLRDTLSARSDAGEAVERAQTQLNEAREENPVPPAPSEFCAVKP